MTGLVLFSVFCIIAIAGLAGVYESSGNKSPAWYLLVIGIIGAVVVTLVKVGTQ